jgi:hypothetical protein
VDGHFVMNDETGGSCKKCKIEDAEAPIPTKGDSSDDKDDDRKKKQIVGSTLIPPGLAYAAWGWRDVLRHCLREPGRRALPDWIFVPTIECSHALLRLATGIGVAGAGTTPFFTPPDKKDKPKKCQAKTAKEKKKSPKSNPCLVA